MLKRASAGYDLCGTETVSVDADHIRAKRCAAMLYTPRQPTILTGEPAMF
jgi:hypothetical protein